MFRMGEAHKGCYFQYEGENAFFSPLALPLIECTPKLA